jgi:anthranilate phosphoribosyltransferase
LGIRIDLTPMQAATALREHHFAFFFAPRFHPAFKHLAAARKLCADRNQRTIFNFLGPLLNPARPTGQLIGVPHPELCEPIARVLQSLGVRRGMVVSGRTRRETQPFAVASKQRLESKSPQPHLDELSILGDNFVAEFYQDRGFSTSWLAPENFPLQSATLADLAGGDARTNAEILRRLLRREERGPKRDVVLLNAGAALFVAGKAKSLTQGWESAADLIDSGTALAKLDELVNG